MDASQNIANLLDQIAKLKVENAALSAATSHPFSEPHGGLKADEEEYNKKSAGYDVHRTGTRLAGRSSNRFSTILT
jgi:hypothetical protein